MSGDSWALDYDTCAQQGRDLMARIHQRNQQQKGSASHSRISAEIRSSLRTYSAGVTRLRESLIQLSTSRRITGRESERRQGMLDELITKEKHLNAAFKQDSDTRTAQNRSMLMGNTNPFSDDPCGAAGSSRGYHDDDDDPLLAIDDIQQQQQQAIRQQDEGLDALSSVLHRQKQMAIDIGNEVDHQDDIIDDIHDHVDRTDHRLIRETKHIKLIDKKSATCWYWVVIVVLLIAIVIVAVVPKP